MSTLTNTAWYKLTERLNESDVIDEFHKKFQKTIVGFKTKDQVFFAIFKEYKQEYFYFIDENNITLNFHKDNDIEVFVPRLNKGFYNSDIATYFCSRHPARQWKHGVNFHNTFCSPLLNYKNKEQEAMDSDTFSALRILCKLLKLRYFNIYVPNYLDESIFKECHRRGALGLTDKFAITLNPYTNNPDIYLLYYYQYPIGFITNDEYILCVQALYQEMIDEKLFWNTSRTKPIRVISKVPTNWRTIIEKSS